MSRRTDIWRGYCPKKKGTTPTPPQNIFIQICVVRLKTVGETHHLRHSGASDVQRLEKKTKPQQSQIRCQKQCNWCAAILIRDISSDVN